MPSEQIAGRLDFEHSNWKISYNTIYRGIALNSLGEKCKSRGVRGFACQLRHRCKTRKVKETIKERRGRFNDVPSIHERQLSAESRTWFGHWKVTLVDRKSRYLLAERVKTLTLDCGTNENINGLIRECFPKGTDLNYQEIIVLVTDLNNRPRKVLG